MQRLSRLGILLLVAALTVTCAQITVNIYFPAAEIHEAAMHIEREVRREPTTPAPLPAPDPTTPPRRPPQGSGLWPLSWPVRLDLGVPPAAAQQIDINLTTPAIRRLIAARQQRYPSLVPLFVSGALGENSRGLVEIRMLEGLSLQNRARAKALSDQENSDRQQLYQALAEANNIPQHRVTDIALIFARVHRQEAQAGWWIQDTNGQWQKK
jgi:uncharacterized protein YdbL (DUF1318 family)